MSINSDISYEDLRLYIEKMAEQDKARVTELLKEEDISYLNVVHLVTGLGRKVLPCCSILIQSHAAEDIEGKRIFYQGRLNPWGLDEYSIEVNSVTDMITLMNQYLVLSKEEWK